MRGKSIKLYIMGDSYKNIKTAELSNWTGKAYIGKRKHISLLKKEFDELSSPGVYFLLSDSDTTYLKNLYIGEADDISLRLTKHFKKSWWESFVCFISKDSNLTKAHVRYIERKIYEVAINNKTTINIKNTNKPPGSKLPISDCDDMDEFCENVIFVLKNLGILDFTKMNSKDINKAKMGSNSDIFYMYSNKKEARLIIENGAYILLKGSYIRKKGEKKYKSHNYTNERKRLEKEGYFIESDDQDFYILKENISFPSPTAAACVVRNTSLNGRVAWKLNSGTKLDDYENEL